MQERKYFPIDIFAVKKYGVEKWHKDFFWPVSDKEFFALCRDVEQCMARQITAQPKEIGDLFIIQYKLFYEYTHLLHALKVVNEIKKGKKNILYSENALWYRNIVGNDFKTYALNEAKKKPLNKIKSEVKDFLKCLIYNVKYRELFRIVKKSGKLEVCGSLRPIMKQYIKGAHYQAHFTPRLRWLAKSRLYKIPEMLKAKIAEVSKNILNDLRKAAAGNDIMLREAHIIYLRQFTNKSLLDAVRMLNFAKIKIEACGRVNLLVSGFGDPLTRALCMAARQRGGRVISLSHGGNIGLYDTPLMAFSEFAFSDEFITYAEGGIKLFEKTKNGHPLLTNNKVKITPCNSNQFLKKWQKHGKKPLPKRIKKVMILGYPHNQLRKHQVGGGLSLMHLDLELRIANILTKCGYEVLYKVHPDRAREVEGVFESKAKILKGYFQNYMDAADAYLFGSIRTSAFSDALCTNKPIIGFAMKEEPYKAFSEAMEPLKKRCNLIYTEFDERNRMVFDEKELLDALSKRPVEPNIEFIETFMFPKCSKKG